MLKDLSCAQKDLVDLEQYYEGTSMNNIGGMIYVGRETTYEKVNKALNTILKNFESYRIRIVKDGEKFQQYVSDYEYKEIPYLDFKEKEAEFEEWLSENINRNIFMLNSPLYRFFFLELPSGECGIFLLQHHTIADGWSMTLVVNSIINELLNLNKEIQNFSYLKIIDNEKKYLKSKRYEKDEQFWSEKIRKLGNNSFFENVKNSHINSKRKSYSIDFSDSIKIMDFCENYKISISNLFSAAMFLVKNQKTQSQINSIGLILHNRNTREEKYTAGAFLRVLPLIMETNSKLTVEEYIEELKKENFGLLKHRKFPYSKMIESIENPESLLDCVISYQNTQYDSDFSRNNFSEEWFNTNSSNTPLMISISNRDSQDYFAIDYDYYEHLLSEEDVDILHNKIIKIIKEFIENPNQLIGNIEITTEAEKDLILNHFNNTKELITKNETVIETFEKQVKATPENIALIFEEQKLTYRELNEKANQLAHYLRNLGIRPNDLVGIISERRLEMIIGIFGILKAGGAYVPIDPNHPNDRINYILEDSQPKALLTDRTLNNEIIYSDKIINLTDEDTLKQWSNDNLKLVNKLEDLIYVIYTSGTTGKPKGVKVPYNGVMNRLNWMTINYRLTEEDTILFKTPFTFDVSVWEIFGWIMFNGQIVLLPSGYESNPTKIKNIINEKSVTMVHFVPSMLKAFLLDISKGNVDSRLESLKFVLSSGEELRKEVVKEFNDKLNTPYKTQLKNLYGPTETSIEVTEYSCDNTSGITAVPIGKPISNIQAYILDQNNKLMGIGMPGELCIGGVGVTDGYLNKPDLTSEKFVDNPFTNGKMYRTGDLVKWHSDGNIEYLGRIDEQVKIRGYRIELGEIESTIQQLDEISDVAVITKTSVGGDKALYGYLVSDNELNIDEVKAQLRQFLPSYMVPSYMMQIEKLPITSNGKLDKKVLPEITINQREYVAPRNEIETNLVQIFEEVLNTENVSINDNFFEIGGDSLKAIKVTSILSKKWNITIKDIFEFKTIMLISKVISNREEENMLTKLEKLKSSHPDTYDNSNSAIPINYKKETLKNYSSISSNNIKDISSVLLTGVTGYLGIHLLNNLLKSTYSKIYLLIRNKSINLNKISELWAYYFEENIPIYFLKRLKIIYGNIENEHLNLNSKMYEDLSKNIDIIINSAANVSHFSDREDSYKTNVYSLHNLLKFANHNKKKEFHHMSTISIASGNVNNDISKLNHFTENDLNISQNPNNVYVESKISAEEILRSNEYSNLNINIYRLGNLQCDSKTGIFQKNPENNAFFRIIKSFKNFGIYPLINNDYLEFTEVDKVSEACVKLICNSQLNNETYHLFNNNLLKLSDLMSIYISLDFNIKSVSWNDFIDLLIQKFKNSSIDDDLDRFLLHTGILDGNIFNSSDFEIHSFKTNFILNKLGFNWESIDKGTLKSMINHSKNSF